jgi:hypothetical protein
MTKQISPAELAKGMFVTVLENRPFVHQSEPLFGMGDVQTITHTDRSGMGDVHTVLSVELPYVVIRRESKYEHSRFSHSIDTRRTTLMELSREYVEALLPHLANTTMSQPGGQS